ncbi:MAG: DNA primase [Desulfuromonadales bacterium]|nr:DNA primase [Desulfuromonadales bacterium]
MKDTKPIDNVVDITEKVEKRRAEEAEHLGEKDSKPWVPDSDFVWECLANNERGDGVFFASLQRGRFVFETISGEWLFWQGHHWQRDVTNKALAAVEDVAMYYVGEARAIGRQIAETREEEEIKRLQGRQSRVLKRADRLRSTKGRKSCLEFAATCGEGSLVVTRDQLDSKPWLLPCKNGVVNLQVCKLEPGNPDDYLTIAAPVDFPEDCSEYLATGENSPCPIWEGFVLEIMGGCKDRADYLCRLFGYGITGLILEHIFVIFCGLGRNGKGTFLETLQRILGPLSSPMQAELLLDQGRAASPSAPSPHIMALFGIRLAFCSETDQGRKFSASRVKLLSGGDTLTGRYGYDRTNTTFLPTHLLCLATNYRPKTNPDDNAFWSRLHLIEFSLSFVERPSAPHERKIDKTLPEKLLKESSGILAWLVRGCLLWQNQGLNPPPEVLASTAAYRRSEDDLADWIESCCVTCDNSTVTAKLAYASYKEWYLDNLGDKPPSQKRFGDGLSRRYGKDRGAPGGAVRYLGVGLQTNS